MSSHVKWSDIRAEHVARAVPWFAILGRPAAAPTRTDRARPDDAAVDQRGM